MNRIYLALAAAAVAFPAYAQAPQTPQAPAKAPSTDSQSQAAVSKNTQEFIQKAAVGDMYEIQSSKMALDKSQNSDVQDFAQKIVDDHTKSSNELKSIVDNMQGVEVPNQLDSQHQQMIEQLQSASDAQFIRRYKEQQIKAHEQAVQLYETYAEQGDNEQLKQFADKTLPALEEHLQMAQDLPEQSGAPGVAQAPQGNQKQQMAQGQSGQPGGKVIARPSPDHIIASDLQGTTVYSTNDEEVGEVNEVVLSRDGEIVALVVGVGGFLGIGEKDVAIPFDALEIRSEAETTGTGMGTTRDGGARDQQRDVGRSNQQQETGRTGDRQQGEAAGEATLQPQRIVLRGMTKQELESAPSFETKQQQ